MASEKKYLVLDVPYFTRGWMICALRSHVLTQLPSHISLCLSMDRKHEQMWPTTDKQPDLFVPKKVPGLDSRCPRPKSIEHPCHRRSRPQSKWTCWAWSASKPKAQQVKRYEFMTKILFPEKPEEVLGDTFQLVGLWSNMMKPSKINGQNRKLYHHYINLYHIAPICYAYRQPRSSCFFPFLRPSPGQMRT